MAYDLNTAKTRLMIAGNTQDAMVQLCLDSALDLAEQYCDRKFMLASETATITHSHGDTISLPRYPLVQVNSVSDDNGVAVGSTTYHVINDTGQIVFDTRAPAWHQVQVSYQGGYTTLPAGLELALWLAFDAVWAATPGAGKAAGSGPAVAAGGAIKSIASPDIGTISYFDPNASSSGGTGGAAFGGLIPASAAQLLDLYRRESC
jgi:hypothetical protein